MNDPILVLQSSYMQLPESFWIYSPTRLHFRHLKTCPLDISCRWALESQHQINTPGPPPPYPSFPFVFTGVLITPPPPYLSPHVTTGAGGNKIVWNLSLGLGFFISLMVHNISLI